MRAVETRFEGPGIPIDGYGSGGFRVAGAVHRGPLALLPGGAVPWAGLPDLGIFLERVAEFDVLLVGVGAVMAHQSPALASARAAVEAAGGGVEVMATPSACRSYNVLLAEGRRVAAALMPVWALPPVPPRRYDGAGRTRIHQPSEENDMAFELPDLPYPHDALAANGMSKETLEFHHDIHHKAYVDNGNKLIAGTEWEGKSVEEVVKGTYQKGAVAQNGIFNNASQHWNHTQFWQMMSPRPVGIPGELERALKDAFGSVDKFKEDFAAAGAAQFGSGWAWLVKDSDGSLKVTKTENGVNPLCFGQTALLGCDVWEHSYYIDFRNKRPAYLSNFLEKLVNWEDVASRLA